MARDPQDTLPRRADVLVIFGITGDLAKKKLIPAVYRLHCRGLLGIPVVRPAVTETTALGAAYLAGLSSGVYGSVAELGGLWQAERTFVPTSATARANELMARWEHAVRQTTAR